MKKLFVMFAFLFLHFYFSQLLNAQTKEEAFNYFKEKLGKLETISFNFVSVNDPNYRGYIIASKTNQFKLSLPDRIVVCDGESIWNYDVRQKQVVISDLGRTHSASLQNIFFNIVENYKPTNLQSALSSKKKNYYVLSLVSNTNPNETLELNYDDKYTITQIKYNIGKNSGNIKISNLKYNPKINKNTMTFKQPKDVEEIDLR